MSSILSWTLSAPSVKLHRYGYEATPLFVHDKKATLNEYNVAMALDSFGLDYLFQIHYWGGRTLAGGQVLDFLVFTPLKVPVQVYGSYWHRGQLSAADRYNEIRISEMVGQQLIVLWEYETETIEDAKAAIKAKII